MEVFSMVAVIVVAALGAGLARDYMKMRAKTEAEDLSEDQLSELEEMRERIQVLEKIVTDEKYQLRRELDSLEEK